MTNSDVCSDVNVDLKIEIQVTHTFTKILLRSLGESRLPIDQPSSRGDLGVQRFQGHEMDWRNHGIQDRFDQDGLHRRRIDRTLAPTRRLVNVNAVEKKPDEALVGFSATLSLSLLLREN